jgi:putative peptide zinc metalloprotease protein
LLRYDGYYVLADLIEIPNLRQKATTILSRKMSEWCLGMEPPEDPFLPQRNQLFFALYSIAAAIYRWVVTFSICWFLYKLFESYDLKVIGQAVVLMSLYGLLIMPLYQVGKFFYVPGRIEQVKKPRFYTSLGVLSTLLLAVFFVPLPNSIICTLEVQPRDAKPVYVDMAGTLIQQDVAAGQQVAAGQKLAQLRNLDIDVKVGELEGKIKEYSTKLDNLMQQSIANPRIADQIPQIQEAMSATQGQLAEKKRDLERLRLVAPIAGVVLPPTMTPQRERDDEKLPVWSGTPLDPENRGATLEQGVLYCQIGDPHRLEAVIIVDQADRNIVRQGQSVDIKLEGIPFKTWRGEIVEIAEDPLKVTPQRLKTSSGGELPTKTDPSTGIEKPMSTSYQARVPIDDPDGTILLGIRGQARVYTTWIPLGTRLWRLIAHTFNFKM